MKHRKLLRSVLGLLLALATLVGAVPGVFAAETDKEPVAADTTSVNASTETMTEEEADAYEASVLEKLYDQYDVTPQEREDPEFGTPENVAGTDGEVKGATKGDSISTSYVFLDMKPGSTSRNLNWQVKTDSSKDPFFGSHIQGTLAAYFQGQDGRLYMPIELGENYINGRLKQYVLKSGDIARIRIHTITANDTFVSGGSETVKSYFGVHTDGNSGNWQSFGTNQNLTKRSGTEQTLTWTLTSGLVGQTLRGVRWDPSQSEIPETRIYIDYIYVGPADTAPVKVEFRNENNTGNLAYHYVGYGKTAPACSTGKTNEYAENNTIWGWTVHRYIDGKWQDMEQFVIDPTTVTCTNNTRFVLTSVTVPAGPVNSTQYYHTGVSSEDDKYVLLADAYSTVLAYTGADGAPYDMAIVMDRSGSQGDFTSYKSFTTKAAVTEYLETLDKNVIPGYYRATCFRKNQINPVGQGVNDYLYTMPMRYYRGQWEMQIITSDCNCNGNSHASYGIYPWNASGMNPCKHVQWVSMEAGFDAFSDYASTTGFTVGKKYTVNGVSNTLYFKIGRSCLGAYQKAAATFLAELYNTMESMPIGIAGHRVSVIGYGSTVFMDGYPFYNQVDKYVTTSGMNYDKASVLSTELTGSGYESVLQAINDTYLHGATRTDYPFQLLAGQVSEIEKKAGVSAPTKKAIFYLPSVSEVDRLRAIVLLSDGVVSSNLEFTNSVATTAIKAARILKNEEMTDVYTIGIADGLDESEFYSTPNATGTDIEKANNFLNLMSSRYKNASAYNTPGAKTSGPYYMTDGSVGTVFARYLNTNSMPEKAELDFNYRCGPGSLWLHEEIAPEWMPDADSSVKIYAEPYIGGGQFSGTKVLIGEHKITDKKTEQTYVGKGYILYIAPTEIGGYSCTLQWTDTRSAFLRETALNLGAEATALTGTLNISKGYKISMGIPIDCDRSNNLGGNSVLLTTENSGCYVAKDETDTEKGEKLISYEQPNVHVEFVIPREVRDFYISPEEYEAITNGTIENGLKYVMDQMVDLPAPENMQVWNENGYSTMRYITFDYRIESEDGTVLYHKAAVRNERAWEYSIDNIVDGIVDLSQDQTFTIYRHVLYFDGENDSFGAAPYAEEDMVQTCTYYPPEIILPPIETEPEVVQALKPGHSLNLESSLSINYVVSAATLAQYDSFEIKCYIGDRLSQPEAMEKDGYVYFILTDINALQMNEMIRAEIYAYKDGKTYVSPLDQYSVATYARNMLNKNIPDAFRKVCVNLLRYGAASQIYKNYNVDSLADESLTEEEKSWLVDLDTVTFGNNNTVLEDLAEPAVKFAGKTLVLDSTVAIKIVVDASAFAGTEEDLELRVSYTNVDGEETVVTSKATVYNAEKKQYMFVVDQLTAAELREVLSCRVYAGDEAVSQTMLYSADTYGNGKTGALLDLCKALFAYVDVTRAYFAAK